MIRITPPQLHMSFELSLSAGMFPIRTVGAPTTHGEVVTGTQGTGVSVPPAAEVAAATAGFDDVLHCPNGMMFVDGTLSMMVAYGVAPATRLAGSTDSALGDVPKLHCNMAPIQI